MPGPVGGLVREVVWNRLSDPTIGYAAQITAALPTYPGIDPKIVQISDMSPASRQFVFGAFSGDMLEMQSELLRFPFMTIGTNHPTNLAAPIGAHFGGQLVALVAIYIEWPPVTALPDFASYQDLIEEAMFMSINEGALGAGVFAYGGRMEAVYSPIVQRGQMNFRQSLHFSIPVRLQVR